MIQRIQTIYFILAAIIIALPLFGMELIKAVVNEENISFTAFKINDKNNLIWIGFALSILLLVVAVFNFKKRKLQIKLAYVSLFSLLFSICWLIFQTEKEISVCIKCGAGIESVSWVIYTLGLAIISIFLGIRGVRKDKALVDSLNRLR